LHALRPAHVADVDQTVDARLDLDECAERREVAHLALDTRADRILLRQREPRILLDLLHAERDLLVVAIDHQHDRLDLVADVHQLRRVLHDPRPRHLTDVDETLDALLQLDECAVVRDRHDLAAHAHTDRVLPLDVLPRIRQQLLEAERDTIAVPVDVEHLHVQLVADLHDLRRVTDTAPAHVRDVQQAVESAQVDERAEVRHVLHDALADLADQQLLHQLLALALALLLEDHATAHDDVATPLVQLDDLEIERLTDQVLDVRHAAQRDLRARQERIHAHQ